MADVHVPPAGTVYQFVVVAAGDWINSNERRHPLARHRLQKAWRSAAVAAATTAGLPAGIGLDLVEIRAVLRFRRNARRDRNNYADTVKAIVDALSPTRTDARTTGGVVKEVTSGGIGLLIDDNDRVVDGPFLSIGEPIGEITRLTHGPIRGVVEVTVTVREGCGINPGRVRDITESSAKRAAAKLYGRAPVKARKKQTPSGLPPWLTLQRGQTP